MASVDGEVSAAIIRAHHDDWARVVATLTRRFGDLDLAEDATAEQVLLARRRDQLGR